MGQAIFQDECPSISSSRTRDHSSNGPFFQARCHNKFERQLSEDYKVCPTKVALPTRHSSVMKATGRVSGRTCALKMFCKYAMTEEQLSLMTNETEIHLTLDHPHIARCFEVYENDGWVYMVMEFCSGGELFNELSHRKRFTDQEAAEVTWQLLSAVCYLHSHQVVHRDLKLENVLYVDADKRVLKLIDFGFAKVWAGQDKMQTPCGSVHYVSPEVLEGNGYTNKCDMWSLGVLVFMLLTGHPPIQANQDEILQKKILQGLVDCSDLSRLGSVSQEAESFLMSLLTRDQDTRMDPTTALCHPWLSQARAKAHGQGAAKIGPGIAQSVLSYTRAPPLRRVALQLVTQQLLGDKEVCELTELFLALADGSTGTIHLEHLQDVINHEMQLLRVRNIDEDQDFHCLDVNQDGQIYYSEFVAATVSSLCRLPEQALRAAFARMDIGRRGKVGAEDFSAVFGDSIEGMDSSTLWGDFQLFGHMKDDLMDLEAFTEVVSGERGQDGSTRRLPCCAFGRARPRRSRWEFPWTDAGKRPHHLRTAPCRRGGRSPAAVTRQSRGKRGPRT